jgi:hypothetical protein
VKKLPLKQYFQLPAVKDTFWVVDEVRQKPGASALFFGIGYGVNGPHAVGP